MSVFLFLNIFLSSCIDNTHAHRWPCPSVVQWQNIKIQLLSNLCCLVAVVFVCGPFIQTNAKTVFARAETVPVSISLSCLLFLSGLVYIVSFLPTCNIITVIQSTDHFSSSCMQTRSHIRSTPFLSLAAPPFFSLSHTYKSPPPPPPGSSLTPNHSLPLTRNDCETTKTLGKH